LGTIPGFFHGLSNGAGCRDYRLEMSLEKYNCFQLQNQAQKNTIDFVTEYNYSSLHFSPFRIEKKELH
jgi:hypothetical protein